MTLLSKIARREPADLLLAAEALILLAAFRVALAIVPVRTILRTITHNRTTPPEPAPSLPNPVPEIALRVRWAVGAVARNSPIDFVCFPQTLAGYTMLRRRRIPSTMVYGVNRSPTGELLAHTWLTLGDRTLLGGEGAAAFSPVERWT